MRGLNAVWFFVLGILSLSCSNTHEGVLTQQEMADVLYDYHLAQTIAGSQSSGQISTEAYADMVLAKHGISQAEFDSSLLWYSRNSDAFYDVYKHVNERLDKELGTIAESSESDITFATTGDTANIWLNKTAYLLLPTPYANSMYFTQLTDTTVQALDKIKWRFKSYFAYNTGNLSAIALLTIRYDNDSVATAVQRIYGSGPQMLTLVASHRKTKEVYGHIYLDEAIDNSNKLLWLSQMMLVRYKHKSLPTDSIAGSLVSTDSLHNDSVSQDTLVKDTAVKPAKP